MNRWLILSVVAGGLLGGCAQTSTPPPGSDPPRRLSLSEFASPGSDHRGAQHDVDDVFVLPDPPDDELAKTRPLGATTPLPTTRPARTVQADLEPVVLTEGTSVVIESLVGQVNGRPIFADEFFEPIADQLRAMADELTPRAFETEAARIVQANLRETILEELFLAEAESGLSQEEQLGLFRWIKQMQEQVISGQGGSRSRAEALLQDQIGLSVDEYVQSVRNRELVRQLLQEKIESRVIVSWRDVEREYQRSYHEFNPPAQANIARIAFRTGSQADQISQTKAALDAGESFAQVAEGLGLEDGGAWQSFELGDDGLAGVTDLAQPIREQLERLEVGETSPAFTVGRSTWWLHLAGIDQPVGRSIYDPELQQILNQVIRNRRLADEQQRYIASLMEGGIYDEMESMRRRLLDLAIARFGSPLME